MKLYQMTMFAKHFFNLEIAPILLTALHLPIASIMVHSYELDNGRVPKNNQSL